MFNADSLNPASYLTVGQMMNKNFEVLHPEDTLRTVTSIISIKSTRYRLLTKMKN